MSGDDETNESAKAARDDMMRGKIVRIAQGIAGRMAKGNEADPAGAFARDLAREGYGPTAPDPFAERWQSIDPTWMAQPPKPRRWLLERDGEKSHPRDVADSVGVLPLGKVGMLAAGGGVGKTMALVQLALAVATGRPWLDTFSTPNPGRVLLALAEEDAEEVQRRVYNAARVMRLTDEQRRDAVANIVVSPLAGCSVALVAGEGGHVEETDTLRALRARLAKDAEWRLIILDPLSRWAGADTEKDNAAATRFVEAVETLALQSPGNPTVLLAHHTAKATRGNEANDAGAARGASALTDGVRWVANLDNDGGDAARLTIPTKSNYSRADGYCVALLRDRDHGGALRPMTRKERDARDAERAAAAEESPKPPKASNGKGTAETILARPVAR